MTEFEEIILKSLEGWNVAHKVYRHSARFTVEEKAQLDRELGISARHCKNIFLTDRKKSCFYLLVMPFEKTFRTSEVSKELGTSRLSFASEELLFEKLRCTSGHLSSLSLIFDGNEEVGIAIDKELLSCEELCFHPNVDTTTVTMKTKDYINIFLPKLRKTPAIVTVTDKSE